MPKLLYALFALAIPAAMLCLAAPAKAEIEYPWCAIYSGRGGGGGTNCGFSERWQCMATISGIGGVCVRNASYRGRVNRVEHERPVNLWSPGIDTQYPWCALFNGFGGGGTNCGFVTRAQCMDTISGVGGICYPNSLTTSRAAPMRVRKSHRTMR